MTLDRPATALLEPGPPQLEPPTAPLPPTPRPVGGSGSRHRARLVAGVAVLSLVAGAGGGFVGGRLADDPGAAVVVTSSPTITATVASTSEETIALVAEAVGASVVSVSVSSGPTSAEGSGVVFSADGLVITNAHVVSDAGPSADIQVTFADGSTADANVVGSDPAHDIAVLRAQGVSDLTPATFGTATDLQVGDTVVAFGSPLGLAGTVSSGIVSALHRSVEIATDSPGPLDATSSTTLTDAIQTDAAVNPGNSGGPLVDLSGRVVGITTAMASINGTSGSIGIGFAITIDTAREVAEQLVSAAG